MIRDSHLKWALSRAIIEDHRLEGVVSMPSGVFKPYAGVSTAIVVFTKTGSGGTDDIWSCDTKREAVQMNSLSEIGMSSS